MLIPIFYISLTILFLKKENSQVYSFLQYTDINETDVKKGFYKPKINEDISLSTLKAVQKGKDLWQKT